MSRLAAAVFGLFTLSAAAAESQTVEPLRFGLLPYVSTQRLLDTYAPLRDYLEATLHRPVMLITAPDFATYVNRAGEFEYDVYLTAPHFAALAEAQFGYKRLSRLARELEGDVIVSKNGPVKSVADLKGRIVATPDSLAIITMLGEAMLRENQLTPGRDVMVRYTPSHNNAVLAVYNGEADAAIVSGAVMDTMPAEIKKTLTIIVQTPKVPHMMIMASPQLAQSDYESVRRALLNFKATGPGRVFFEKSAYGDMTEITDDQMRQLQPFLSILQQRINKQ